MSRNIDELKIQANTIRKDILKMICNIQSGHLGGSFSMVEVLTALYFDEMHYSRPLCNSRKCGIFSKGKANDILPPDRFYDAGTS